MFHSLTLTKQILAVCSYVLEKRSANGGRKRSSVGHGGSYGHCPRGNTLSQEQQSPSMGWCGRNYRSQPLPGQVQTIHALDAVLPSWLLIHPIPMISRYLGMKLMANGLFARSWQMPVLWPWWQMPGTVLAPTWMESTHWGTRGTSHPWTSKRDNKQQSAQAANQLLQPTFTTISRIS